jgi:predicted GNAT superfamily acetyltransferase
MVSTPDAHHITVRRLESLAEYSACVRLQEETWGKGFPDLVPTSILLVTQKIGGIVAGAFDEHGAMVGFVFGMAGYKNGRPIHWSDMLAVVPSWRNAGVGTRLKLFQRAEVLKLGVEEVYWTFDPLVARNGRLNLVRLGAEIDAYVPDMYLPGMGDLHRDLGMDRCIAVWRITSPRVEAVASGLPLPEISFDPAVPSVNPGRIPQAGSSALQESLPDSDRVYLEVPPDIHAVRDSSPSEAQRWRESTRQAFLRYLGRGYRVLSFVTDSAAGRCYYLLRSPT